MKLLLGDAVAVVVVVLAVAVGAAAQGTSSIYAAVNGLTSGTVILQDNLGDTLTLTPNTAQYFATQYANGSFYSVSISSPPVGQNCTLSNASGTITSDVTVAVTCATTSTAYTESILYNFSSASGGASQPTSGLVRDTSNNLFGASNGTIFKLSSGGTYTILSQAGGNSTLVRDSAGTLYGTSPSGGLGYGFVYKFTSSKKLSVLHKFGRVSGDGLYPQGPVTLDSSGNMYGTTQNGGDATCNCGTIYKITAKGVETVLYKFLGGSDGSYPLANVLRDGKGNMFGTTSGGSNNGNGVVWKLNSSNVLSVVYTPPATDFNDSQLDYVVRDAAGNFYTELNGFDSIGFNQQGGMVQSNGVTSTFYSWYFFFDSCPLPYPIGALLFTNGTLYGTEEVGGAYAVCDENNGIYLNGGGDVYSFTATGGQKLLYSFPDPSAGLTDGFFPANGVISDSAGNFYGTTQGGGLNGMGTIFKLTKN